MKRIIVFSIFLFILIGLPGYSLDFNVSPNKDGSLDMYLGLDWNYSTNFFSGIKAEYLNISDKTETESSYVATSGKTLSAEMDILGYRIKEKALNFDIAANVKLDNMKIREIGYIDSSGTRYFILNDRILNLMLPRLKGKIALNKYPFSASLAGEYSPWLYVDLQQELTISPGLDKTPYHSAQPAYNAFSINMKTRLDSKLVSPFINLEYDNVAIKYRIYTAGGEAVINTLMQNLSVTGTLVLSGISLNNLHPSVSAGYEWDWATDLSEKASKPILSTKNYLRFGFEF